MVRTKPVRQPGGKLEKDPMHVSKLKELAILCAENIRAKMSRTNDVACMDIKCELLGIVDKQSDDVSMFEDSHIVPAHSSVVYKFTGACDGSSATQTRTVVCHILQAHGLGLPLGFVKNMFMVRAATIETRLSKMSCSFLCFHGDKVVFGFPYVFRDEWCQVPYQVSDYARHLMQEGRRLPRTPMTEPCANQLFFALPFFDELAAQAPADLQYRGTMIPLDGSTQPQLVRQVPLGHNPLDGVAFWLLPSGNCSQFSARCLAGASQTDLRDLFANAGENYEDAYREAGRTFRYDALGVTRKDWFENLHNNPGTIGDRAWKKLDWEAPQDHAAQCWWLTNPTDRDSSEVVLMQRSAVELLFDREFELAMREYHSDGGDAALAKFINAGDKLPETVQERSALLQQKLEDKRLEVCNLGRERRMMVWEECRSSIAALDSECVRRLCRSFLSCARRSEHSHANHTAFSTLPTAAQIAENPQWQALLERNFLGYFLKSGKNFDATWLSSLCLETMVGGPVGRRCVATRLADMQESAILDETDIMRHEYAGQFLDEFGNFFRFGKLPSDAIRRKMSPASPQHNVALCAAILDSFGPPDLRMKLSNAFEEVFSSATKMREVANTHELFPQAQLINIYRALSELSAANQAYKVQCLRNRHLREAMPQIDTRHGGQRNVRSQDGVGSCRMQKEAKRAKPRGNVAA